MERLKSEIGSTFKGLARIPSLIKNERTFSKYLELFADELAVLESLNSAGVESYLNIPEITNHALSYLKNHIELPEMDRKVVLCLIVPTFTRLYGIGLIDRKDALSKDHANLIPTYGITHKGSDVLLELDQMTSAEARYRYLSKVMGEKPSRNLDDYHRQLLTQVPKLRKLFPQA